MSLLAALALQAASPAPESYRALGASPFWRVSVGHQVMVFETPGREIVTIDAPPRQETGTGFSHDAPEVLMSVEHRDCRDAVTGLSYRDTVVVVQGGTTYEGCGGPALVPGGPPDYFAHGGEPFWSLDLADGRMTYRIDGEALIVRTPSPLSTRSGSLRIYEAPDIHVFIRRRHCELDDGRTYANAVTVTAGGRTVEGCGGRVVREAPED